MRRVTRNLTSIEKQLLLDSTTVTFVETIYLNTDMCKSDSESSQSDESRAQSPDSSKVCRKPTAFKIADRSM